MLTLREPSGYWIPIKVGTLTFSEFFFWSVVSGLNAMDKTPMAGTSLTFVFGGAFLCIEIGILALAFCPKFWL